MWFRGNLLVILNVIKIILMGVILILVINIQVSNARQAQTTKELVTATKHIADQINQSVKAENHNTNKQLGRVNAHLDCIVQFFSQPDRSQKAIADIDTCQLKATESAQGVVSLPKQSTTAVQPKTQQTAPMPATQQATTPTPQPQPPAQPTGISGVAKSIVDLPSNLIQALSGLRNVLN